MISAPLLIFCAAILLQARFPERRLQIVLAGAGASLLALSLAGQPAHAVLAELPWDVLVILAALGVVSHVLGLSQVFTRAAVAVTRRVGASSAALVPASAVAMFLASGLVNNITALMLVLPVVLAILQLAGTTRRHLRWTLGTLLVACNLGGAATPIGDFPAVLLLGAGAMGFVDYLRLALPTALAALALLLLVVVFVVKPARDVPATALRRHITVAVVEGLHARIAIQWRLFVPGALALVAMLVTWTLVPASRVPPHLVAWLGAGALVLVLGRRGREVTLAGIDVDAGLFLLGLLVMVGAVRQSGLFLRLAEAIRDLPFPPAVQLGLFVVVSGLATGLFSAGPSMAALLEVADALTARLPAAAVYIGLAFGVCAGSSLLLTAATSGPLAQSMVDRAGLCDLHGQRLAFSFSSFLPVGLLAFALIAGVGVAAALLIGA